MNIITIRNLAEAIILQSIKDLWDEYHKEDCRKFFSGEELNMCAGMAGMNLSEGGDANDIVHRKKTEKIQLIIFQHFT